MTRFATMAAIATILMLGGCQFNGTIDASNLLNDGERIVITKETVESNQKSPEPVPLDFSASPIYDPGNSNKLIGYSIVEDESIQHRNGLIVGSIPGRHIKILHNYDEDKENHFDEFNIWVFGAKEDSDGNYGDYSFKSLPSGTVTYGSGTKDLPGALSSLLIRHGDSFFADRGRVSIEVNFDEGKITKLDGYTNEHYDDTLKKYSYEHALHLADSDHIPINMSTGTFSGNASLVEQKFLNSRPLEVRGTFHGSATDSAISGLIYNNETKGAFLAFE